ncbi:GPP34 family phosphoprotein [uncultured Agrococcus sp.]|uniref:GOLPH3/VPS74 family protein n=1 Tax=uncultured Agrococcus sp. TaxID=382258 RepID=UPI0025F8DF1D|nr:GPP34 family phosphoprotein [uncultured Agrococcus sp.]
MMLTSEALFLLLTTDAGKHEPWISYRKEALRGGLLADLVVANLVEFAHEKDPHVTLLTGATEAEHPVLRYGVQALGENEPDRASNLVQSGWFDPEETIAMVLADQGIITVETKKFLFFSSEQYPMCDPEPERRLRSTLAEVLADTRSPTAQDVIILAILQEMSAVRTILKRETEGFGPFKLNKRLDEIRQRELDDDTVTDAVREAIQTMAAIMTSVVITPMH